MSRLRQVFDNVRKAAFVCLQVCWQANASVRTGRRCPWPWRRRRPGLGRASCWPRAPPGSTCYQSAMGDSCCRGRLWSAWRRRVAPRQGLSGWCSRAEGWPRPSASRRQSSPLTARKLDQVSETQPLSDFTWLDWQTSCFIRLSFLLIWTQIPWHLPPLGLRHSLSYPKPRTSPNLHTLV